MRTNASWLVCVVLVGLALAEDAAPRLEDALSRAGPLLGAEFRPIAPAHDSFLATVTSGLETCEGIDLEVHVVEAGGIEVSAYPCLAGGRIDVAAADDVPGLLERLSAAETQPSPFAWVVADKGALHARHALPGGDGAPAALERALLASRAVDRAVAGLLPALGLKPRLTEAEITARLREAGTADEAGRNRILASLSPYLPELTPSDTPGSSTFRKLTMNARGTAFDAFRFHVPAEGGDRRLVWSFAYPPGTAKGWYIAPVSGTAPKFTRFHKAGKLEGTDVPAEHAVLLQRSETALRAGAVYVIWFQFKVETPVDLYFALGCFPFAGSDRDGLEPLSAALGLKTTR